jgi:MFS family permease
MNKKSDLSLELRRLYAAGAGLFAVLALVAGVVMQPTTYQVVLAYLTSDELSSRLAGTTMFAHGQQVLFDVELRWILVAFLLLSAVVPTLYVTRFADKHKRALKDKVLIWRWLDLAVTGAIVLSIVALLVGVQDLLVLKLVAGMGVAAAGLWWLAERQNAKARKAELSNYLVGVVVAALPWLLILGYVVNTFVYGNVRAPWFVYAAIVVVLAGFVLVALNQLRQYRAHKQWKDYPFVERNYWLINMETKAVFAIVLIIGLSG